MNQLSPQARRLLELARSADDPGNLDQARVGRLLASRLAAGGELATSPVATKAAAGKLFAASLKPALLALGIGGALGGAGYIASSRGDAVASSPAGSSTATTMAAMPGASAGAARVVAGSVTTSTAALRDGAAPSLDVDEARAQPEPRLVGDEAQLQPRPQPSPGAGADAADSKSELAKRTAGSERSLPARPRDSASNEDTKSVSGARDANGQESDVSAAPKVDPLRAEAEGLREAQRALRSGQAQKALDLLAAQDARFASGLLAEERAAARVLSLCQAGLSERARLEATRFAARWPRSALLSRVQAGCLRE